MGGDAIAMDEGKMLGYALAEMRFMHIFCPALLLRDFFAALPLRNQ